MFGQPKGFFALAALPIDVLYNDGKIGESTCCPPHFFDDQATIPATQRMVGESLASPDVGNHVWFCRVNPQSQERHRRTFVASDITAVLGIVHRPCSRPSRGTA